MKRLPPLEQQFTVDTTLAPSSYTRDCEWGLQPAAAFINTYATDCFRPGLQYFETNFGSDLSPPLSVFKAARLFSPMKVDEMKPVATDVKHNR